MNQRTFLSTFLFLILLLASCKEKEEKKQHALPAPMEEIDTTSIKKSLLREIKAFVDNNNDGKTFIIYSMRIYKQTGTYNDDCIGCRDQFNELFCICEASESHFDTGEFTIRRNYPHRYIDLNGKIIFVQSEDDAFYNQEKLKNIYENCTFRLENRQREIHSFLLYDLKDSCETIPYDSIYSLKRDIVGMVEIVKKPIKFTAPDIRNNP